MHNWFDGDLKIKMIEAKIVRKKVDHALTAESAKITTAVAPKAARVCQVNMPADGNSECIEESPWNAADMRTCMSNWPPRSATNNAGILLCAAGR